MTMDGSKEQTGRNSKFQTFLKIMTFHIGFVKLKGQTIIQKRDVLGGSTSYGIAACLGRTALSNSGNMVINMFRKSWFE